MQSLKLSRHHRYQCKLACHHRKKITILRRANRDTAEFYLRLRIILIVYIALNIGDFEQTVIEIVSVLISGVILFGFCDFP